MAELGCSWRSLGALAELRGSWPILEKLGLSWLSPQPLTENDGGIMSLVLHAWFLPYLAELHGDRAI